MIEYSEHKIESGNTKIVLSLWEPKEPEAAIVFIPATMLHSLCYEPLLRGFAERGYAVAGLHPIGHGKSPRDMGRYTLKDFIQNAYDAVSFMLERYNAPVLAMGASQGGIVAAGLAAEDDRLAAVFSNNIILSELPDTIKITRLPKVIRRVYRLWKKLIKLSAFLLPDLKFPMRTYLDPSRLNIADELFAIFRNDPLCLNKYPLYFLSSLLNTQLPGITNGSINCPVYIVTDTGDKLFEQEYTQKVFDRLRAPYKELISFHTGGHMFMLTSHDEVCNALAPKIHEAITRVSRQAG